MQMKKTKLLKQVLIILAIIFGLILLNPIKSNAALQSIPGATVTKPYDQWPVQIRQMQSLGGTLGRTDTINGTTLRSNATDLDIHMEKNTEYGAMAILSASSYGNPNPIPNWGTTTGNSTGVQIIFSKEATSASYSGWAREDGSKAARYVNWYTPNVPKVGDATAETAGWHGSVDSNLSFEEGMMARSTQKSIFSYHSSWRQITGVGGGGYGASRYDTCPYSARAVIVVGTGI